MSLQYLLDTPESCRLCLGQNNDCPVFFFLRGDGFILSRRKFCATSFCGVHVKQEHEGGRSSRDTKTFVVELSCNR